MSFIVQKSLGNSFFRFAVSRRRELRSIDPDHELSTGPSGEFVRHRPEIFYSADLRTIHKPEMPQPRSIAGTPFWSTIFDGTPRSWIMMAMMAFGGLLVLLGLAVMKNNRVPGIMEVLIGLVLIGIPIFFAWQKRSAIKRAEDRVRREREERDRRNAELLGAYTSALEKLRETPDDATLALVRRENEKLDLPYAIWADTAIGTVLYVGFSTLARVGPERAEEVAQLMDRASDAAGLIAEDAIAVKHALYSTILWHMVADDRLGDSQLAIVRQIQKGFGIDPEDVPIDTNAETQFERLRGIDHRNAPRCESQIPLSLNEYCMYSTPVKTTDGASSQVSITNKRFLFGADQKKLEVAVAKVDDILVDADRNKIVLQASELKRPLEFHADEPIYLAAMIDLATRLDDRPKSFT